MVEEQDRGRRVFVRELLLQRTGRVEWEGVLELRFEDDQFDLVQLQTGEREVLVRQVLLERPQETAQGTEGARARKDDDGGGGGDGEEEVSEKKKKKKTLEVTSVTRRRSKIGGERETKREERKKFERRLNASERTENEALGRPLYLFFNKNAIEVHD